jgi:4-hydroxy-3-methylbut-2-en-1-yl diphosphate synthase IspG/GcpE
MVLAAAVLAGSLALLALHSAVIRVRLVADARWRVEGALVASSALATVRVAHRPELEALGDGATLAIPSVVRSDGWSWSSTAVRTGSLLRVGVTATRHASDGTVYAAHAASLLLVHDPADTVRVLASRARF